MENKSKFVLFAAIPIAILSLVVRVWQITTAIDYEQMGFFAKDSGFASVALYLLFAVAGALFIVLAVLDKKRGSNAFEKDMSRFGSKCTALLGLFFLASSLLKFYEVVFGFDGIDVEFIGEAAMLMVYLAVSFILLANKRIKAVVGFLQTFICIGYTAKAASLFISDTIIVRISHELLLLLSYAAAVLFFLALGRFLSGNEQKFSRYRLIVFSAVTLMFSTAAAIAPLIGMFAVPLSTAMLMPTLRLSDIGLVILSAGVLVLMYAKPDGSEEEIEQPEETTLE